MALLKQTDIGSLFLDFPPSLSYTFLVQPSMMSRGVGMSLAERVTGQLPTR